MSLVALASPELCATALRQGPPRGPEEAVRVILDGSAAMGLAVVCGPWDRAAEVDAVRVDLGLTASAPAGRLEAVDRIIGWLVGSPGARPVTAPVSGPLSLANDVPGGDAGDVQEILDAAADVVADRVRRLCELGVAHVVVLEGSGRPVEPAGAAEAHTPVARLTRHHGVAVTLVALDDGVPAAGLGYERWVTPTSGSDGLALVTGQSLREGWSWDVDRSIRHLVTDYLVPGVEPASLRAVAACAGGR